MVYKIRCLEGHTEGMPVRMAIQGLPEFSGSSLIEFRQKLMTDYDWLRKALVLEPRGCSHMSGTLFYPPVSSDADFSLIFVETSGWLPMCGHATIGSITFALEAGLVKPKKEGEVTVDVPAGKIRAFYQMEQGKVQSVRFVNVPSFLFATDYDIDHPTLGKLTFDVAFGGNFYPIIDPQANFPGCEHFSPATLLTWGGEVQDLINQKYQIVHPDQPDIKGVKHCMWGGAKPLNTSSQVRSVVIAGKSLVDRSPCGTGTSARVAQRFMKGMLGEDETFTHESLIGSQFIGRVSEITTLNQGTPAIRPSVEGTAWTTGNAEYFIDQSQAYWDGFDISQFN